MHRVAMVSEHASPLAVLGGVDAGGQNVHVDALARELARRGVAVDVYTRRHAPGLPDRVEVEPRYAIEHLPAGPPTPVGKDQLLPHVPELTRHLTERLARRRPDVAHAHFWMSGLAATAAGAHLGIPVVETFHALGVVKQREQGAKDTSPPERLALERRILHDVDQVVATCSDEAFELMRLGLEPGRISVIPCGVELDRFHPHGPAEPRPAGRHRIAVVTRLVERKGIGNAIEALASVPDTELVVCGGPPAEQLDHDPEARRLRHLAEQHGVADRVVLRGQQDRDAVAALLRSADLLVTVPWYEPFGIVPLEAMACGTPVVASAVGGLLDTVIDGLTGLHVPPRSPARVAEAVNLLLADDDRRRAMGAAAAERAQQYSWSRVGEQTLAAYRCVLADVPTPVTWPGRLLEGSPT